MAYTPHKIWESMDLVQIDELEGEMPTKEKFIGVWNTLDEKQKKVVHAAIGCTTFKQVYDKTPIKPMVVRTTLLTPVCMKAFYLGTVLRLPSKTMMELFVKQMQSPGKGKTIILEDLGLLMSAERNHLKELAEALDVTGDGKRNILKMLMAYGMQHKIIEPEVLDKDGKVLAPPIWGLADPKMTHAALKEMNMMDHEYGEDDKATSSIESQSDRIRRLKKSAGDAATKLTNQLDRAAKRAHAADVKQLENLNGA